MVRDCAGWLVWIGRPRLREEPLAQGHTDSPCRSQDQTPEFQTRSYPKICALKRKGSAAGWSVHVGWKESRETGW